MKKLLSVLLALCMVISMVTVAAVSVGAAEVGAGAATGASARTIYVGVVTYLNLNANNYQVHYWGGSDGAKDAALTATGKTVQQAVGSAYWSNQPQPFNMYTASIPADATGYKVHNGNTWFGADGNTAQNNTAYVFEYGGNYNAYYTTTQEQEEPATDEPTQPETDAPAEGAYYIVGTMNGWAVDDAYKLTANEVSEGEYMFLGLELAADDQFKVVYSEDGSEATTWYPDGTGNNYGENGEITAAGTYDVYFRPDGQGGEDWFYNVLYVAAQEEPGTEPETQPGTEPATQPATDEPTQPATADPSAKGAYYIVGNMNDWTASDEYKLTKNEASTDNEEYMFEGLALTTTSEFKVVYTTGDEATAVWYPGGDAANYGANGEIKADGTYTVYFRPNYDGFDDWFNKCIIAIADEQPGTEPESQPATEPETQPETQSGTEAEVTEIELDGDYYLVGYIGGADYNGTDYKFTEGKLTATFAETSYVCIKNADGDWYMTNGFDPEATEAILYKADSENNEKLMVPAGKATFTLKAYSDGTYKLSYVTEEITPDESSQPGSDAPADTITVKFTDAMFYGNVNVYFWPNGGDWPGKAMTEVDVNDFNQKVYTAEIPADVEGIIFNGNGRQTVDIKEGIEDGAWWYTVEKTDEVGHNYVELVGDEDPTDEPSQPATDEPTQPATADPSVKGAYYIVGTMNDWTANDEYKLTKNEASTDNEEYMFEGLALTTTSEFKVVYTTGDDATAVWYPGGDAANYGANGEIKADGTYTVYFRPNYDGFEDWFNKCIIAIADEQPGTEPETQPATDEPTQPATADPSVKGAYYIVGNMNDWTASDEYKLTKNEASTDNEEYMFEGLALTTTSEFKVVYTTGDEATAVWYPGGDAANYGANGEIKADGTYTVYFRPNYDGFDDWFNKCIIAIADEQPGTEPESQPGTEPETQSGTEAEVTEIELDGDFFLVGYIGGADYNGNDYKFTEGKLTATFADTSYVCIKNADGDWYMTSGFDPEATEAILYKADSENNEKLMVPAGKATFTLKAYSDGTYKLSYVTEEITTDEPTEPVVGAGAYYIVGTMNDWTPADEYKLTENEASEGEYMFLGLELAADDQFKVVYFNAGILGGGMVWYPDGSDNNYGANGEIKAAGTYDVYFRPDGQGGEDWFYNVLYVAAQEEPGTEPESQPGTEPETQPGTDAPAEGAYYIVGTMNDWTANDEYKLTANEASEGEYMFLGLELTTTSEFKVMYQPPEGEDGVVWYPDGTGNNYGENGEITADGTYDVYFRPDGQGGEDWFYNVLYVAAQEEPGTEPESQPGTEPETQPGTDEPAEGAYYIVGTMNDWTANDEYKLTKNEASTDNEEYMFEGLALTTTDAFKVVYTTGDEATAVWYPGGNAANYGANGEIKADGTYTVYFRPNYDGFEDWFNSCIIAIADEQPGTEPGTEPSEPGTEPSEPGTEPTEPGEEDTVLVAGSEPEIFGTGWDAANEDNLMTKQADGTYTREYTVEKAYDAVQLKAVVNGAEWIGDLTGNNVTFNLKDAGTFTVIYHPAVGEDPAYVEVTGDIVEFITEFTYNTVYAVGNGEGYWLNGASWDPAYAANEMTEIADDVWEITFENVPDGFERQIKFAIDGAWTHNFGGAFEDSGVETVADYNGNNITFDTDDICTVKAQLDLTEFDFTTKTGAKFTITITYEDEPILGDIDGDGEVTINDATMLQRYFAEFIDLTDDQLAVADVNEDGKVNIRDVTAIQRMVAEF